MEAKLMAPVTMIGVVLSTVAHLLIELFCLPARVLRLGPAEAGSAARRRFRFNQATHRWRRGDLQANCQDGPYVQRLPSGKLAKATMQLVGGDARVALVYLDVDDHECGVFFQRSPGADTKGVSIQVNGAPATPLDALDEGLRPSLNCEDAPVVARFLRTISFPLT